MNALGITQPPAQNKTKSLITSSVSYIFDYSVFVQTIRGIEEFKTTKDALKGHEDDLEVLSIIGYKGDIDEVMAVMCTRSNDTTANEHFVIQVITDNPEQNTFRFDIHSESDLTILNQIDLLAYVDENQLVGEVYHVSCSRLININ